MKNKTNINNKTKFITRKSNKNNNMNIYNFLFVELEERKSGEIEVG